MSTVKAKQLVEPGSTEITKTGAWRTFVPRIDQKKCIKCSLCEIYCPESSVHQVKDPSSGDLIFDIDLNYCKGCGICEHECPRHAIKLELEEK